MFYPFDWNWRSILQAELNSPQYRKLCEKINTDKKAGIGIYPSEFHLFRALELCPIYNTKVVILGQDPYHTAGVANGLAFSVLSHVKEIPPSLKNIARALKVDLGIEMKNGDLSSWASQGVLLLNSILSVEQGKPMSHKNLGWEEITDKVITYVNASINPVVFMLWGKESQKKESLITNSRHLIIKSSHPSPLSASQGFIWHKPFSQANNFFKENGMKGIEWDGWF